MIHSESFPLLFSHTSERVQQLFLHSSALIFSAKHQFCNLVCPHTFRWKQTCLSTLRWTISTCLASVSGSSLLFVVMSRDLFKLHWFSHQCSLSLFLVSDLHFFSHSASCFRSKSQFLAVAFCLVQSPRVPVSQFSFLALPPSCAEACSNPDSLKFSLMCLSDVLSSSLMATPHHLGCVLGT